MKDKSPKDIAIEKYVADKFPIKDEGNVLIIREGDAPKLLDEVKPNKVSLKGTLNAPSEFYNKRKQLHDKNKCHVVYDKNKGMITLNVDEQYDSYQVSGQIQENPDLAQFKINTTHLYGIKELMQLLKFNRIHFIDKEANAKIVLSLQNFKGRVEKILTDMSDNRGNDEKSKLTKIEHDLEESFKLQMPIYKGGSPLAFTVDICVSATSADVQVWLESKELKELQESNKSSILEAELSHFSEIVCIEQ